MVKSSPGVPPKPRFGPNLDSTVAVKDSSSQPYLDLYTILSSPILYGVWKQGGGSV